MTSFDKRVSVRPRGVDQGERVGNLEEAAPQYRTAPVGSSDRRGGNRKGRGGEVRPTPSPDSLVKDGFRPLQKATANGRPQPSDASRSRKSVTPETAIRTYGPMARRIAREFFLPGSEREDVEQEAYIGLLGAVRSYRPETGIPFRPFAAMCVRRWLMTCVSAANRDKRALNETEAFDAEDTRAGVPELAEYRAELHRIVLALRRLSPLEARCVVSIALGFSYAEIDAALGSHFKGTDNAIQRARKKLAA